MSKIHEPQPYRELLLRKRACRRAKKLAIVLLSLDAIGFVILLLLRDYESFLF